MKHSFSYDEYTTIIKYLSESNTILDYADVTINTNNYCVIRHDVEFSVDRALNLAIFESTHLNLSTSYLFQVRNNCYNIASDVNLDKLKEIQSLGHKIGIHIHLGLKKDSESIEQYVKNEINLFEQVTQIKTDRFSFHRPTSDELKKPIKIANYINCYDPLFFHHYESPHNDLDVKYFTDSRHQWQHGYPTDQPHDKVQLLTHPYSWSKTGANNYNNYKEILKEKEKELRESINRETSTFPTDLL